MDCILVNNSVVVICAYFFYFYCYIQYVPRLASVFQWLFKSSRHKKDNCKVRKDDGSYNWCFGEY